MRMHLRTGEGAALTWPWIEASIDVLEVWSTATDPEEVLIPAKATANTTLKAFYGAPVWTIIELGLVRQVLSGYGVRCKNMPSATALVSARSSCT